MGGCGEQGGVGPEESRGVQGAVGCMGVRGCIGGVQLAVGFMGGCGVYEEHRGL